MDSHTSASICMRASGSGRHAGPNSRVYTGTYYYHPRTLWFIIAPLCSLEQILIQQSRATVFWAKAKKLGPNWNQTKCSIHPSVPSILDVRNNLYAKFQSSLDSKKVMEHPGPPKNVSIQENGLARDAPCLCVWYSFNIHFPFTAVIGY